MDALILASSDLETLVAACGTGTALGVGLTLCFWGLGYVGFWVIDLVRGGVL